MGEKGIWGRKSLFDESSRVPLVIAHPNSPYRGSHVFEPVELVDLFPTILDLVSSPHIRGKSIMHAHSRAHEQQGLLGPRKRDHHRGRHEELSGKSLASLVVGSKYRLSLQRGRSAHGAGGSIASHRHSQRQGGPAMGTHLHSGFALTQALRCADWSGGKDPVYSGAAASPAEAQAAATNWRECALGNRSASAGAGAAGTATTVMGYSMRTLDFRYTLWLHFDPSSLLVQWERGVYAEELYDHREDGGAGDLGKYELVNLRAPHAPAETKEAYREAAHEQRSMLVHFLHRHHHNHRHCHHNCHRHHHRFHHCRHHHRHHHHHRQHHQESRALCSALAPLAGGGDGAGVGGCLRCATEKWRWRAPASR